MIKLQGGFTLVELVIFIIGVSILISGIFLTFTQTITYLPTVHNNLIALQLADQCMEGFIGERRLLGFADARLNCSNSPPLPSVCTTLSGFTVSATINCTPTLAGDTATSRTITVRVTGSSSGSATLTTLIADY